MVTNNLMICQASFIKLLNLWINSILIDKLSILIWAWCLTVVLIATIRKTSNMVGVIKELLMCLLRSIVHLLQMLASFELLLIHSLLLLLRLSILVFWNISICICLSGIHLKLLLVLLLILLLLFLSSERVVGIVLIWRVICLVELIIRVLLVGQSNGLN